jgi:uncharacterized protein YcfJ
MTVFTVSMTILIVSTLASASERSTGHIETAEVILAEPVYESRKIAHPVRECWNTQVTHDRRHTHNHAAPIAGGILGGLAGNSIGKGRGRKAMTVVGTLLGATIGHNVSSPRRRAPVHKTVRRCKTVNRYEQQQHVVGYRVKFRYEGQNYTTHSRYHPGETIPLRVSVEPAG